MAWEYSESNQEIKTWLRSWRQEFFTDLGSDFTFRGHMEKVVIVDGEPIRKKMGIVERRSSSVIGDQRIIKISELLTELLLEWYNEDQKNLANYDKYTTFDNVIDINKDLETGQIE